MTVKAILDQKGREVSTAEPDITLMDAAAILHEKKIGAIVLTGGQGDVKGILSERDIIRAIALGGADALQKPVSTYMTKKVVHCYETSTVDDVMAQMTDNRFRHLPVLTDGKLAGIVSIGDVVRRRIDDVEREAAEMKAYIAS